MIIETSLIKTFTGWLIGKVADKGFEAVYEKLTKNNDIDDKFIESIKAVADKLEKKYPDILGNSVTYFFTKNEVFDELCKLLFVNQNVNISVIEQSFDGTTLPKDFIVEFICELKNKLSTEPVFYEIIANKELFIAVKGISKNVEEISDNSTLTKYEIIEIKKILEKQFREKFNLESFKALYQKNLLNNIGEINFIGLGIDPSIKKGKRKELDSIFVKPFFKLSSKYHIDKEANCNNEYENKMNWNNEENCIPFQAIFDRQYNYVILGNPGSGKSLLIKSIILYISNKANQFNNLEILSYIPFRIELKNYLSYKKNKGGNLLKYIAKMLEEEYSVLGLLDENLHEVLTKEKSILFFDGLDEIFNVTDKINIKNDIENFHNLFPKIKSITTSRYIGYNEAKLDKEKFCELNIQSFNEEQIQEYVSRWYLLEEDNEDIRNLETADFISKMDSIDNELISNPLLLSLIVILYRNNLKIPDSKLEIYQSCTNTLVDKWDASKNLVIQIDEKILQKKEPIFSDLAFWQYETLSSSNTEVTYHKAKATVSNTLVKKKVADEDNCGQMAEIFLNYAQKRSIYFDNNFTHKTFLEYYTAFWIYSNIEMKHNIDERNRIIKKYISNPFWSIVLELLLNMIDKDQPDSDIIDEIIEDSINNPNAYPFLVYIIPNLKNISMDIQELVYYNSIKYLTDSTLCYEETKQKIKDLFSRIQRNLSFSSQQKILDNAINRIEPKYWNKNFFIFINEISIFSPNKNLEFDFSKIDKSEIYNQELEHDQYLFQIDSYRRYGKDAQKEYLSIIFNYVKLFGVIDLFNDHHSLYDSFYLGSFIRFFFYYQFKKENIASIHNNLEKLNILKLKTVSLINFVLNDHIYILEDESIQYLFDYIEKGNNEIQKAFYTLVLIRCLSERDIQRSDRKLKIENYRISTETKEMFEILIKLRSRKRIIESIVEYYKIEDVEILQLATKNKQLNRKI